MRRCFSCVSCGGFSEGEVGRLESLCMGRRNNIGNWLRECYRYWRVMSNEEGYWTEESNEDDYVFGWA